MVQPQPYPLTNMWKKMVHKITQQREKCIGCGTCVSVCSENWEMKEDGKSTPKKVEVEEVGCNQEAADNCPVEIISVEEEK